MLDDFTESYLEAALWLSDPDPGSGEWEPHGGWTIDAIDPADVQRAIDVCREFQTAHADDLRQAGDDSQNGHDFWLTRNGHGAGFWDRAYGAVGDRLTEAAHAYGEANVYGPETNDQGGCSAEQLAAWDGVIHISE